MSNGSLEAQYAQQQQQQLQQQQQQQIASFYQTQLNSVKEQLQLHVQTIGILVAEKTEMQSKLAQQTKKCDKKQDECDELTGRLKASRLKMTDMEKQIQQLQSQQQQASAASGEEKLSRQEVSRLKTELNTNQLLIDELKIRFNETNERLAIKHQENQKLAQLTLDLKSQLEIMQLRLAQLSSGGSGSGGAGGSGEGTASGTSSPTAMLSKQQQQVAELEDEVSRLREANTDLERQLNEASKSVNSRADKLKAEYQAYVEQLQKQTGNLDDHINRMSDERENVFAKIDQLETKLKTAQKANDTLRRAQASAAAARLASGDARQQQLAA